MTVVVTWWVEDVRAVLDSGLGAGLDDVALARVARLRRTVDQDRSRAAAHLARAAISSLSGQSDARLVEARRCGRCGGPHGRPTFLGSSLDASISHSGHVVAVAVTSGAMVGIDVEAITGARSSDELQAWVRIESVLKATADGLTVDPRDVVLEQTAIGFRTVFYPGRPSLLATTVDLVGDGAWVGAVTMLDTAGFVVRRSTLVDLF